MSTRIVVFLSCFLSAGAPAWPQAQLPWRFWSVADGLLESNTSWIETDGGGTAWARHGVPGISRLDGYSVSAVADEKGGGRLGIAPDGGLWIRKGDRLRRYYRSRWETFTIPGQPGLPVSTRRSNETNAFAPLGGGKVLILNADAILEFDTGAGKIRPLIAAANTRLKAFTAMRQGRAEVVLVAGKTGVMRIQPAHTGGGALEWRDFPSPPGVENLSEPREGDGGEVFAAASKGGKPVLMRLHENKWSVIYAGRGDYVQAWRASDGDTWAGDGNQLLRLSKNGNDLVPRTEVLSGIVMNSSQAKDGSIWISTTQGIARYAPPIWRSAPATRGAELDELVNSICEDGNGAIWFLSARYLIRFDGDTWSKFRLPEDYRPEGGVTESLAALESGDLALATSKAHILLFHPATATFRKLAHPQGRIVRMFGHRRNGDLLVETLDGPVTTGFKLETFDGRTFHTWLDLSGKTGFWDVRAICETSSGDLWFGAVDAVGVYRNGRFKRAERGDGFKLDGAFSIFENTSGQLLAGGRKDLQEFDGKRWTTIASGLDRARSIARSPDGTTWVASGTGIHRVSRGSWITNDVEDGLPAVVAYKVFVDRRGRVWAGTLRGISQFHPEADSDPPRTIVAEEFNSHSIAPREKARVVFSGIDKWKITEAGRLLFSYRLDGGAWTPYARVGAATYAGLNAARHRFEVRAMDRNGNVDPVGAVFDFTVIPSWYRQTGFLCLTALGIAVILYLLRSAVRHHRSVDFESKHDPLTRLFNRRAFEIALERAIEEARSGNSRMALMLLDLDQFKPVNDTLGHAAGDRFLREIAQRIKSCLGPRDFLARVGGDEFAIIVRGAASRTEAAELSDRIRDALSRRYRIGTVDLPGSASIGVAVFPDQATDSERLQELADRAMYNCKARHKGLSDDIGDALEQSRLSLHYQPILDKEGFCFALEALVRAADRPSRPFAAEQSIAFAEQTGSVVPLGEWVLNEACRQLAQWRIAGHRNLRVSVNVSRVQLALPGFTQMVTRALTRHGLGPGALILEITETAVMADPARARMRLEELRADGITVALDDFGKGYSSLHALHTLPVDMVKIDRTFTQSIGSSVRGEMVLSAAIQLAHQLGFLVVAEGIETGEQKNALLAEGCDLFQGFLAGHPVPAEEVEEMLKIHSPTTPFHAILI